MVFSDDGRAPGSDLTEPGAVVPGHGGSRTQGDVQVVIFLSMEELIVHGPVALRPWLARRLMLRKRGPGTVVEFEGEHQQAGSKDLP